MLEELFIDQVGGNAIFVNNHNRRIVIRRSHIADAWGNGVAFVGDPANLGLPSRTLDSKIKRLKINVYPFKTPR